MIRKSFPCWEDRHRAETIVSTVFSVKTFFFFKSHSLGGCLECFALFLKPCQVYNYLQGTIKKKKSGFDFTSLLTQVVWVSMESVASSFVKHIKFALKATNLF